MKIEQIAADVFYQPDYHIFLRTDRGDSAATRDCLDNQLREGQLVPVARRIEEWKRDGQTFVDDTSRMLRQVRTVAVEMTESCNMRCSYCYVHGSGHLHGGRDGRRFRHIDAGRIVGQLTTVFRQTASSVVTVAFLGGEPLLQKRLLPQLFADLRDAARSNGKELEFQIITNGTLLDRELLSVFADFNVEICLSLDGPRATHDKLRVLGNGRGSFDQIMKNIDGYQDRIGVLFTLSRQNKDITDTIDFFLRTGFRAVSFNYVYSTDACLSLSDADVDDILADIDLNFSFYRKHYRHIRNLTRLGECLGHESPRVIPCNGGRTYIGLDGDGEFVLCQRCFGLDEMRMDALLSENSPHKFAFVDDIDRCRGCWARYICAGECWFGAWYWSDEYLGIRCKFIRELVRRVARLRFTE